MTGTGTVHGPALLPGPVAAAPPLCPAVTFLNRCGPAVCQLHHHPRPLPLQLASRVHGTGAALAQCLCDAASACSRAWAPPAVSPAEAAAQLLALTARLARRMTTARGAGACAAGEVTVEVLYNQVVVANLNHECQIVRQHAVEALGALLLLDGVPGGQRRERQTHACHSDGLVNASDAKSGVSANETCMPGLLWSQGAHGDAAVHAGGRQQRPGRAGRGGARRLLR